MTDTRKIAGVILAGGGSRRFEGGAKELARLNGISLIEHVIKGARTQVESLALGRATTVSQTEYGMPVICDEYVDAGPLAGVHAGVKWAKAMDFVATFACDTPFFPEDLVARLCAAARRQSAEIVLPRRAGTIHTVFGLWSTTLLDPLEAALCAGERAMTGWALARNAALVDFDDGPPRDFFNVNAKSDLDALAALDAANRRN